MFEVGATIMSVTIRNTVPVPIAPVVLPVDAVPAPAAGMVNQFDERCRADLDGAMIRCERGRLCRHDRQGYPADEGNYHSAHLSLDQGRKAHCTGAVTNRS